MPPRLITPSSYVGKQVAYFRGKKGWSQQELADRLQWLGFKRHGWGQTKIAKLETDRLKRVSVDDLCEVALALDVSPLYLLTPLVGHDENGTPYKVWLGGGEAGPAPGVAQWPHVVRQWIRGVKPILGLVDYPDEHEARRGQRFYLLDSQPISELQRIVEAGEEAKRLIGFATDLVEDEEENGG